MKLHESVREPFKEYRALSPDYTIGKNAAPFVIAAIGQKLINKVGQFFDKDYTYQVNNKVISELHNLMLKAYHDYGEKDDEAFERFWQEFEPIVRTHRALVKFIFRNRAYQSRTYGRWVIDVARDHDYARAMLVVTGKAYDWLNRPQEILPDDVFMGGITHDWCLVEARWRQMKTRSAMLNAEKVAIVGAGYLPELLPIYGGTLPANQEIVACDPNGAIDRKAYEEQYPNLTYLDCDALTLFRDPANKGKFDLITMPGVMCYNLRDLREIIRTAMDCLRPGGQLIFDMLVLHLGLLQTALMLDWGLNDPQPMQVLPKKKTIQLVSEAAKNVGASVEMSHSGMYKQPPAIFFELTKPL